MKLDESKFSEAVEEMLSTDIINMNAAIENQKLIVSTLKSSSFSSGQRGDELFKLACLYYQNQDFSLAKECAVEAMGLIRLFYGRNAKEFLQAFTLIKLICAETQKTEPPRRRRRSKVFNQATQ